MDGESEEGTNGGGEMIFAKVWLETESLREQLKDCSAAFDRQQQQIADLRDALSRLVEVDKEAEFIDAWNKKRVRRVSDGAKPWVGLTDEDKEECLAKWAELGWWGVVDVIEAKLREKNGG